LFQVLPDRRYVTKKVVGVFVTFSCAAVTPIAALQPSGVVASELGAGCHPVCGVSPSSLRRKDRQHRPVKVTVLVLLSMAFTGTGQRRCAGATIVGGRIETTRIRR
jgi:hypothetical protein